MSLAAVGSTNGVVLADVQGTVTAGTVLLEGRGLGTAASRVKTNVEKLARDAPDRGIQPAEGKTACVWQDC